MRAGLATLDVLEQENLGERALVTGEVLRERLRDALAGYEMVREVRGRGMMSGIEFQAPSHLKLRAPFEAFRHIHKGMFGQIVVMRLYNDHRILTQVCGNNFMVLKVAPPLIVSEEQLDRFVAAARSVVDLMHNSSSFWTDALGLARNTVVIFTADHGEYMGDHQLLLKGPIHYQSLIRVPFIWAEPAAAGGGTRRNTLAGTVDIAQTILERAGMAGFNGMQGISLVGAINGVSGQLRDALIIEEEGQRVYMGFASRVRVRTLVTERYRLSVYDGVGWGEFYDLQEDPHELINLWGDAGHSEPLRAVEDRMIREMIAVSDTSPRPSALA